MGCYVKGSAIFCSRGRGPRARCQEEGCKNVHSKLCDFPIMEGRQRTCDKRLCDDHAISVGPDSDVCQEHGKAYPLRMLKRFFYWSRDSILFEGVLMSVAKGAVMIGEAKVGWGIFIPLSKIRDSEPQDLRSAMPGAKVVLLIPRSLAEKKGLAR